MAYKIQYKKSVFKDLKKIDRAEVKKVLDKIDTELANNPGIDKVLKGSFTGLYSYRVENYRVIYSLLEEEETMLILRISHRKNIYDKPI